MIYAENWEDYALIDASDGNRLERWGGYVLIRPDPQAIWSHKSSGLWREAHAVYERSDRGGGAWRFRRELPERWRVDYAKLGLGFEVSPMGFKHTGVFPEQAVNWEFMSGIIRGRSRPNILNLFAYTGGASLACAKAGASVCHVDAQKNIIRMAKRNAELSGADNIRYIADDCAKFVARELRRGNKYDGVILDPPSYGRGAGGEIWKIEDDLFSLLKLISGVMSDAPLFVLVNLYTAGLAPSCAGYMLSLIFRDKFGGTVESDEIGIYAESSRAAFPCGAFSRWVNV